jgi:hypothetical protein
MTNKLMKLEMELNYHIKQCSIHYEMKLFWLSQWIYDNKIKPLEDKIRPIKLELIQ